jgi:stringent starvation protein B
MYDWLIDNKVTPYIIVDTTIAQTQVPQDYVHDNKIILNLAPMAIQNFEMTAESVAFDARFHGVVQHIFVPYQAIEAIYASENGRGILFDETFDADEDYEDEQNEQDQTSSDTKPNLRVIK